MWITLALNDCSTGRASSNTFLSPPTMMAMVAASAPVGAAAHRSVEHGDALCGHRRADLLHHRRRVGRQVDVGLALGDVGQDAAVAQGHRLDVLGHGQRGHDDVGALGDLGDRLGGGAAQVGAGLQRRRVQVEHRHLVVGALDDVAAHGTAHVADADKSDLHGFLPKKSLKAHYNEGRIRLRLSWAAMRIDRAGLSIYWTARFQRAHGAFGSVQNSRPTSRRTTRVAWTGFSSAYPRGRSRCPRLRCACQRARRHPRARASSGLGQHRDPGRYFNVGSTCERSVSTTCRRSLSASRKVTNWTFPAN